MKTGFGLLRGLALLSLASLVGCAGYRWTSDVPASARTVSVPTFRNESNVTQLGSAMTRQLLREFQREGTFEIRRPGDAALEVQGVVKAVPALEEGGYDRRTGIRLMSHALTAIVEVSVVDKRKGVVLIDNRQYRPQTTFTAHQDLLTAERDASGRLADDLSRMVVDDILNLKWDEKAEKAGEQTK